MSQVSHPARTVAFRTPLPPSLSVPFPHRLPYSLPSSLPSTLLSLLRSLSLPTLTQKYNTYQRSGRTKPKPAESEMTEAPGRGFKEDIKPRIHREMRRLTQSLLLLPHPRHIYNLHPSLTPRGLKGRYQSEAWGSLRLKGALRPQGTDAGLFIVRAPMRE